MGRPSSGQRSIPGAILLGLAYLRTRRLALPIGIHFGWNWAKGAVLGFDVSGLDQAGWRHLVGTLCNANVLWTLLQCAYCAIPPGDATIGG